MLASISRVASAGTYPGDADNQLHAKSLRETLAELVLTQAARRSQTLVGSGRMMKRAGFGPPFFCALACECVAFSKPVGAGVRWVGVGSALLHRACGKWPGMIERWRASARLFLCPSCECVAFSKAVGVGVAGWGRASRLERPSIKKCRVFRHMSLSLMVYTVSPRDYMHRRAVLR